MTRFAVGRHDDRQHDPWRGDLVGTRYDDPLGQLLDQAHTHACASTIATIGRGSAASPQVGRRARRIASPITSADIDKATIHTTCASVWWKATISTGSPVVIGISTVRNPALARDWWAAISTDTAPSSVIAIA